MTQFLCPVCGKYRSNYVDDDGSVRGIECDHVLLTHHPDEW